MYDVCTRLVFVDRRLQAVTRWNGKIAARSRKESLRSLPSTNCFRRTRCGRSPEIKVSVGRIENVRRRRVETTLLTDVTKRFVRRPVERVQHVGESDDAAALHPFNIVSLQWTWHSRL